MPESPVNESVEFRPAYMDIPWGEGSISLEVSLHQSGLAIGRIPLTRFHRLPNYCVYHFLSGRIITGDAFQWTRGRAVAVIPDLIALANELQFSWLEPWVDIHLLLEINRTHSQFRSKLSQIGRRIYGRC